MLSVITLDVITLGVVMLRDFTRFLRTLFINVRNKLACLSLASLSSLV
jgi:hypothetical protein